jgi:hypothetical protein
MTNTEATMSCYCTNDTPCRPCLDAHYEESMADAFNAAVASLNVESESDAARRSFEAASADFYIPGWTPDDEDELQHTLKIIDDMREEAASNPDMALALLNLYGDDVYSHEDYRRDVKADVSDYCPCNYCANALKWYN